MPGKFRVLCDRNYQNELSAAAQEVAVTLAAPVYGPDGEQLFDAGRRLDEEVVEALKNKLFTESDLKLRVGDDLDAGGLRKVFLAALGENPDFKRIHLATSMETTLMVVIGRTKLSPKVAEHLAVMRARQPVLFTKTILGAWVALAIARQLGLEKKDLDAIFRAALCRDLGMLYVHSSLLSEENPSLRVVEREEIQRHVELSAKLSATLPEPGMNEIVEIVSNHHEREDRSGYPRCLGAGKMSLAARVVALADVVVAVRFRVGAELNLSDVMTRLLLEREAYDVAVFETFLKLVREGGEATDDEVHLELVHNLLNRSKVIADGAVELETRLKWAIQSSRKVPPAVIHRARRVLNVLRRSGHADRELSWWLKRVGARREEAGAAQLREIEVQQLEMLHQIGRLEDELGGGGELTSSDVMKAKVIS